MGPSVRPAGRPTGQRSITLSNYRFGNGSMWAKTHVSRTQVARTHVAKTQARAGPESGVGRGPVYTRSGYLFYRAKFDLARPEAKREHHSFWGGLTGREKVDLGSLLSR